MAGTVEVPVDQFKAVMRSPLSMPPMPASDIPRKREPRAKKAAKKRNH